VRDDALAVFVNGREVFRQHLPYFGPVQPNTPSGRLLSGAQELERFETLIDPRVLRSGTNVIAVELHQASPSDDDASFDLDLSGL
jgi:hypothetical protein